MKIQTEAELKVLQALELNPSASQRQLADQLGLSLGKINYCLRALVDVGLVKAQNFQGNSNKKAYRYLLTPSGLSEKFVAMRFFLQRKQAEYESLKSQIELLAKELEQDVD